MSSVRLLRDRFALLPQALGLPPTATSAGDAGGAKIVRLSAAGRDERRGRARQPIASSKHDGSDRAEAAPCQAG
jgi:hypothetical protein